MLETKIIELAQPVEFAGTTYDKIPLREPTVGEVDKAFKANAGLSGSIMLISLVSDIPRGAIEKLPMRPFREASDFLAIFTESTLPTTES